MEICRKSSNVVSLIEKFTIDDYIYIVTKHMKGGDLLSYLEGQGVDKLPESQAHYILR